MRFKGTIFLTLLLILLGFYLYGVEIPNAKKKQEILFKEGKLYNFQLHEISRITIRSPKGEVEFEYFPGHPSTPWRIFHPVETIANQNAAEEIATRIVGLKASRLVEAKPKELKEFGLDPAPYRILVTINQTDTEVIEIGDENLTGTDVYLRKGEGTSLYLVPSSIKTLLNKDLNEWRQREIFPFAPEDIFKIKISSPRGDLNLNKEEDHWVFESQPSEKEGGLPLKVRGNQGEIANLLGSLVNFRGDRFIDFKKNQWKSTFGPPLLKVFLQQHKVEREATFYKDQSNPDILYVVMSDFDPIFQISESDLESVDQPFNHYRDKRLLALDFPEQIASIVIKKPTESYTLTKKDGQWWIIQGNEKPREAKALNRISRLQTDLYHLQLDTFKDGMDSPSIETGLKNPQLSIFLKDQNGLTLGELDFGRIKEEMIFGKSTGQPHPFLLNKAFLKIIPHAERLLIEDQKPEEPGQFQATE